ncbi:uncharacterized protein LOC129598414 [Paramacrobiotus metropolitanus]|uniref:uncharacterized protein LOC129598414 n=1 Tax=Paramacrobiotus metropolitanus TaxID=2943436 RepID=UPI0024457EE8|nr:uncharacterized protein LOC129598414 [Paramacrobiotus metropolitanus]
MPSGMHRENAVDVLFDDGMMRYGRVVDVAVNGLFVNLLCPNRRREFVPFDRLFVLSKTSEAELAGVFSKKSSKIPVEVLVEETRLGPWIWIPGEAVSFGCGMQHGIVAKWRRPCNGEACTDFVPSERIRWTVQTELNRRRLAHLQGTAWAESGSSSLDHHAAPDHAGPGTFVKQTLQLDDEFRSLSAEETAALMKRLNGCEVDFLNCTVAVVDVVDGGVVYICRPDHSHRGDSWTRHVLAAVASFDEEMVSGSDLTHEVPTTNDQKPLPGELFMEVFSYLDTVTQMALRAVCAAWNAMLEEPVLSGRITMSLFDYTASKWRFHRYLPVAAVYKRLQLGTQHITMTHSGQRDCPAPNAAIEDAVQLCAMSNFVTQLRTGIRLRRLHLDHFYWDLLIDAAADCAGATECVLHQIDPAAVETVAQWDLHQLQEFIGVGGSLPCSTLLLTNGEVNLVCPFFFLERVETASVTVEIRTVPLPIGADFGCALWEAMDALLPVPDKQKVEELLQRLQREQDLQQVVCKMLCTLHSADPRPSAHYHGKQWCEDGLRDLQLDKLSRIARHLLVDLHRVTSLAGREALHV